MPLIKPFPKWPGLKGLVFVIAFLLALLQPVLLQAQEPEGESKEAVKVERSDNKVVLDGRVYYIHMVKAGQTLYSISRAYGITEKEIAVENPGVYSGLQIGQVLKIPMAPGQPVLEDDSGKKKEAYDEEGYNRYRVKRRDTMYSIARRFGVTQEDIMACNPELEWSGLRAGEHIWIPRPGVITATDTTTVAASQDSLSVDSLILEEEFIYEELPEEHANIRRTYKVAYFIPFHFEKNIPLDTLLKEVESAARRARIIEKYQVDDRVPQSAYFLEFFQGSLLAIDSMQKLGMKLDVRFYDTHRSLDQTLEILSGEGMEDLDLIIGPFYPFNLELVSAFSRQHRIPIVAPFYNERDLLEENPYLFQVTPSLQTEYDEVAKLVASKYDYNLIYVRSNDSLDVEMYEYLKEQIFSGLDSYHPVNPVLFKEVAQKLDRTNELLHSLSMDRKNLVIAPTSNEAIASSVVSSLVYQQNNYDIELIGSPFWTRFTSIDDRYYHELEMIYYSPFRLDYTDAGVNAFLKKFRKTFYTEPAIPTKRDFYYGIAGYDISYYFLHALRTRGPRFILDVEECHPDLVLDTYVFNRVSKKGGYENQNFTFYRYKRDLSIEEFTVPALPVQDFFYQPLDKRRRERILNKD